MSLIVEVLPDVTGIDRAFAYEVCPEMAGEVTVGSIVKVMLHGRRVRGWVVAVMDEAPAGIELHAVKELSSLGPPPQVVDLSRWAAWRYSGRLRPLLVAASPPRLVRALPPSLSSSRLPVRDKERCAGEATLIPRSESAIAAATLQALSSTPALLRLPPAAARLAVVEAVIEATAGDQGDLLVLAASRNDASTLANRLQRSGHKVALQPDQWAKAASGGRTVVGTRGAVLSPVARLSAVVVLDAHADSYQEERVPTWEAVVLATERARRDAVPCLLVSPCPTLELLAGRRLVTFSREVERAGWARIELIDAREEDPRAGGYPTEMASAIRDAARREPGRPVLAVVNRKGRARLLACSRCRGLLRCGQCGSALAQIERPPAGQLPVLSCPRCSTSGPASCTTCGPTRPRIVKPGVSRVRDDLEALTGLEVAEVGSSASEHGGNLPDAPVLVGTEAVLHRATSASIVVFPDFDHEILAPRYLAGEQALALLALASRLVGGRRRDGRVVVRTRLPEHEVLDAALHADPGRLEVVERARRAMLSLPPTTALALVSGEGADQLATRLRSSDSAVDVGTTGSGRYLIRAAGPVELADALASVGPPPPGTRVEVAPRHV